MCLAVDLHDLLESVVSKTNYLLDCLVLMYTSQKFFLIMLGVDSPTKDFLLVFILAKIYLNGRQFLIPVKKKKKKERQFLTVLGKYRPCIQTQI